MPQGRQHPVLFRKDEQKWKSKKGDRIPTNWRNWCKDDPTAEVVGFSYNSRTREDAIILRAYEKDHDEYSWVKGTLPQISEKHDSLYWAQGEYGTTKNLGDIPNGFQPDRRESISVPGYKTAPREPLGLPRG